MPDGSSTTIPPFTFRVGEISYRSDPVTPGELADRVGDCKAAIADLDAYIGRMRDWLEASGLSCAEGALFRVTITADSRQSTIDRKKLEADLGEVKLRKYLKWSARKGSFLCTAKTGKAVRS